MGEYSKAIGEQGEEIVEKTIKELFGFSSYRKNIDIDCSFPDDHNVKKDSKRRTHGIDGLISYKNPLIDCLEIGVVSVKFTNKEYPNQARKKFREHFKDLAWTLSCFKHSETKSDIESKSRNVHKTNITGILFWLSNNDQSYDEDLSAEIAKAEFGGDGLKFEKIIFIDNARLKFLYEVLSELPSKYTNPKIDFVYPRTGFNNSPEYNLGYGKEIPLSFLANDIIPIRVEENSKVILHLSCRKNFDTEELVKIIGLAQSFNQLSATNKTIIGFPNYNQVNHSDSVQQAIGTLEDKNFANQIEVLGNSKDYRNN